MRTPLHAARERQRDDMFANVGNPPPTGAVDSSVSDTSLAALAQERAAARGGQAASDTRSADLDAHVRAATLPPGTTRAAGDGARPQAGGPASNHRGADRNGPAR